MLATEFAPTQNDIGQIVDELARHFAGQWVRWQGAPNGEVTVSEYAIHETPLLFHERELLKAALEKRGWLEKQGKAVAYRFPEWPLAGSEEQ